MANKSRPKKIKAPYRKYVAGEGFSSTRNDNKAKEFTITIPEDAELIETPQGSYYYDETNDTIVKLTRLSNEKKDKKGRKQSPSSSSTSSSKEEKNGKVIESEEARMHSVSVKMVLPWEIQHRIIHYLDIPENEEKLNKTTNGKKTTTGINMNYLLVCRNWYAMCLPKLYYAPALTSKNFNGFVDTIIINKKKNLGHYVFELNLSTILQSGRNSFVSKLLRRCCSNLTKFIAPQTSFGYAPLISLKSCHDLKFLDLGLVSETVKLKELFSAIKNFTKLTHLSFPRSSIDCQGFQDIQWPQNLRYLKLSGGITNEFVIDTKWPTTITTLEFSYCPQITELSIYSLLSQIGDNLKHLFFHYPMPSLAENSLDHVFTYCANLISLQLMVDYCSKWCFSEFMLSKLVEYDRPLKTLYLECSGSLGLASKIHPDDLTIAILESRLPCLKNICVSPKLGFIKWQYKADSINVAIQDGPEAGQSVPHLHTHIIPRYKINNVGDLIYDKLDHWDGNGTLTDWQGRRDEYLGVGGRQARKNNSTSATVDGDELSQGPNVLKPDSQRKVRALTEMKKEAEDLQARLEEFVSSDPDLTQWL
ncbi:CBM_collapsed_G0014730.mRNA.1.CDS.1 [Saccharomyces cerevisiae]|nr:CBM_collapsed_G0014730.mRNA.1.CDS.1 [Saccharomyces cerevisiae]